MRLAAVVVVVAGAVATACGVPLDEGPRPIPDERVPFELLDPAPIPTTAPSTSAGATTATVFMVATDRLAPVVRSVPAPASPENVLQALMAGVVADEAARNLRSAIAPTTPVSVTEEAGGGLRVELTPAFLTTTADEQVLAVAQIVYTLTGLAGVDSVTFTVSGRPVEVPAGDGTFKSGSVRRADLASIAKL